MIDIFISYETTTGLQIAKHLKKSLKKLGLNAFVANEDIKIGNDWKNSIECAIKDCKYFVLVLTNLALGANQVHIEVDRAVEFKKQIILCRKSNVDEKGIDMAFPILSSLQRIDFGNEYELADNVIGTILEREIDLRYSFGLGTYYYEIEKIGEGSFSMVYKAKRKNDNEVVALSIIHRLDKDTREWLIKSISAWTSLKHRNIVRLYDVGISPFFYLEQELQLFGLKKCKFHNLFFVISLIHFLLAYIQQSMLCLLLCLRIHLQVNQIKQLSSFYSLAILLLYSTYQLMQ